MNEKGFIASALLYGMLTLFLVIMISTLYVLGNNKLAMDRMKEKALNNINSKNYYVCNNNSYISGPYTQIECETKKGTNSCKISSCSS